MRYLLKKILFLPFSILKKFNRIELVADLERKLHWIVFKNYYAKRPGQYICLSTFHYYKAIFIHIPKSAGTSTSMSLFGNLGSGLHKTIKEYQGLYNKKHFKCYFKFTVVRNPYDRLVSTFHYYKTGTLQPKEIAWVKKNFPTDASFLQFVKNWLSLEKIREVDAFHLIPQYEFVIDTNGQNSLDFVGKLENYNEDFQKISQQLGLKKKPKILNTSKREKDFLSYYDRESLDIVNKVYKEDFELFHYEML